MSRSTKLRVVGCVALVAALVGAILFVVRGSVLPRRMTVVAYFDNSNGVFVGDDVLIRGMAVGKIENIEPQPERVQITFWVNDAYPVPADAKAVVLSPTLVTARSIQLTPPFSGGPVMKDHAVIPQNRTAVPVEWDEFRNELQKLTKTLQPTEPGGLSTLGEFVNTVAANLNGQAPNIRDSIIKLSQALTVVADHRDDTFTSVRNLAALVSGLQGSTDLMRRLNQNLAAVTALLTDDPNEIGNAIKDFNGAITEVQSFIAENQAPLGTASDKLASISQAAFESLDVIKQLLHVAPTVLSNANNTYQPAQGTISGIAALNNFRDPISFICGAVQAASRLSAEQSAKLCVQYLAPIVKNRQFNFPPLGFNPFTGTAARPNEVTYSEDWMRPDYVPPRTTPPAPDPTTAVSSSPLGNPLAAEQEAPAPELPSDPAPSNLPPVHQSDPGAGLQGMMLPPAEGPR